MMKNPDKTRPVVSLVLPAYNCERYLEASVAEAGSFFEDLGISFEVVCVDDGSGDGTGRISFDDPRVSLLRHDYNQGKGAALKTGMKAATGSVRIFTDADLPYGTDPMALAIYYILLKDYHVVIGDRTLKGSRYHEAISPLRSAASRVFSFFAGRFLTGGFYDTQCGFKAFSGAVSDQLFPRLRVNRFACDVEILYMALINNLDIKRVPVVLSRNTSSTIRTFRDSLRVIFDVVRMKYLRNKGKYAFPAAFDETAVCAPDIRGAIQHYMKASGERTIVSRELAGVDRKDQ